MKVDLMFCPPYRCARGEEAGWVEDGLLIKCFGTFTYRKNGAIGALACPLGLSNAFSCTSTLFIVNTSV